MIASISWRNVWRNRLRSLVIIMAISAGLTGGSFTVAMYNGLADRKLRAAIDTQTAHLQVHATGCQQNKDIRLFMESAATIQTAVESIDEVKGLAPRLVATGMAATSSANAGIQLNARHSEKEKVMRTILHPIVESGFSSDTSRIQVFINVLTARNLIAGLNARVIITMQHIHGEIVGAA